jgi:hypothetical protein
VKRRVDVGLDLTEYEGVMDDLTSAYHEVNLGGLPASCYAHVAKPAGNAVEAFDEALDYWENDKRLQSEWRTATDRLEQAQDGLRVVGLGDTGSGDDS